MIINNQRSFVFIHNAKAAGTTISYALSRFSTIRDVEVGGTYHGEQYQPLAIRRFKLHKHSPAEEVRRAIPEVWEKFFTFGFVRNPFAKVYSLWKFLRCWKNGPHHEMAMKMNFRDFIFSEEIGSVLWAVSRPQHTMFYTSGQELLVNFVGRVERLSEDMSFVLSTIEKQRVSFTADDAAHNRTSEAGEWKEMISSDIRDRVVELYKQDFELFGYSREVTP